MRISLFFITLILMTLTSPGFAEPGKNWAKITEKCISFAPIPDSGVLFLSEEGKVIEITSKGESRVVVLPQISPKEKIRFSDLSVNENRVTFCCAKTQTLYSIDFRNPKNWELLSFKGTLPPKNQGFFRISQEGKTFRLQGLDGRVYLVSPSGEAQVLPPKSILPVSVQGENLVMSGPKEPTEQNTWKVLSSAGTEILSRTAETPETNILDLKVLGFDPKGRVIFIETLGKGEKNNKFFLNAAENGKVAVSKEIEGPGELLAVKSEALLSDGAVCLVRPENDGSGVKLIRVDLGK